MALVLVGDEARLTGELARRDLTGLSVTIRHASQVVEMEEKPTEALRRKKDSSIQVGHAGWSRKAWPTAWSAPATPGPPGGGHVHPGPRRRVSCED